MSEVIINSCSPLRSLKVGDTVVVDSSHYGGEKLSADRIFRVTETQIVLRHLREGMAPIDRRYNRDTGRLIGSDAYSSESVRIATPELLARVEKARLVYRFTVIKWKDLHIDTLRAVNAAIESAKQTKEPSA